MPGTRDQFLQQLSERFGAPRKLPASQSIFEIAAGRAVVYLRYSRLHSSDRAFYGLRAQDVRALEGKSAYVAFLWDGQAEPLLLPFDELEPILRASSPAADGQYKAQVYLQPEGLELYVPRAGRHNIEAYVGWDRIEREVSSEPERIPPLGHAQVQTMLGAIGRARNMDVWVPQHDRQSLDWSIADRFDCRLNLPTIFADVERVLGQIDVVWLGRGSNSLEALYEVEHSTTISSGLLRFNDIQLAAPAIRHYSIVAEDRRRDVFIEQLRRPTFTASGLSEKCSFMTYPEVYRWHTRIRQRARSSLV